MGPSLLAFDVSRGIQGWGVAGRGGLTLRNGCVRGFGPAVLAGAASFASLAVLVVSFVLAIPLVS